MKSPKIGKDNEITVFYPKKRIITFGDMSTRLAYELDAIPKDRNSHFTTRYLNILQKGDVDNSAKWSVEDRIFAILQYGIQQNKEMKRKFNFRSPCQYCGKKHEFTYDYAKLINTYKNAPNSWPVEKWEEREICISPMTGEFETLIEFQESLYWDEKMNDNELGTIEHENFQSKLIEHNANVFFEVQLLRVSSHSGIDLEELKSLPYKKFKKLLALIQKHLKTLNYGVQFWKDEGDHIMNPGVIEHHIACPEPDVEYMKKTDSELLERYKKGGLEAIPITIPFHAQYCT